MASVHACLCAFTHEEHLYECVERICLSVHVSACIRRRLTAQPFAREWWSTAWNLIMLPRPVHCPPKEMEMRVWVIGCSQTLKPTNKHTYTFTATIICCWGSLRLRKTPYKEYKCSLTLNNNTTVLILRFLRIYVFFLLYKTIVDIFFVWAQRTYENNI